MTSKKNTSPTRRRYYTLLRVGKSELRMNDDDYRALLARHGAKLVEGKYSATTMDIGGLMAAVEDMKRLGFVVRKKSSASRSVAHKQGQIKKIIALWCALADAGVVRLRGEEHMVRWCRRITKKARLEWAETEDLIACIEALKSWAKREGVDFVG